MVQIGEILVDDSVVDGLAVAVIPVVGFGPGIEVRKHVFQIGDAVFGSLDVIVAKILGEGSGVERLGELLLAVAQGRIGRRLAQPLRGDRILRLGAPGEKRRIVPLHQKPVVNPEPRRRHPHAALEIARLGDIVETGVIHDRRGRSRLAGERGAPQRIHGDHGRCAHVVHEAQAMPDLVRKHIPQGVADDLLRNLLLPHARISRRGLYEKPVVDQLDHIVIKIDRGADDLAAARIGPRGAHSILNRHRGIPHARIFEVVGVEFRVVLGKKPRLDGIAETDLLEKFAPLIHPFDDVRKPRAGKITVDVKDDRLDRVHQFPAPVGFDVRGLQPPAVGIPYRTGPLGRGRIEHLARRKNGDAAVGDPGADGKAVEQQDGTCGSDRNRHIPQPALRDRHPVIQTAADRNVIRKGLDSGHVGLLLFERLLAFEASRKRVLAVFVERRQPLVIADKQIRGVHDHR